MSKAIQQKQDLLFHPGCNNCAATEGVRVFELNNSPEGNSHQVMSWCPRCARTVINTLSAAFPEEMPDWVKAMQNLGAGFRTEGDEHERS